MSTTINKFLKESEFYESMPENLKAVKDMAETFGFNAIAEQLDCIARELTALGNSGMPQCDNISFLLEMRNMFNTLAQDNGMPCYIPTNNARQ